MSDHVSKFTSDHNPKSGYRIIDEAMPKHAKGSSIDVSVAQGLLKAGFTYRQTSAYFGCAHQTVERAVRFARLRGDYFLELTEADIRNVAQKVGRPWHREHKRRGLWIV